MRSTRSRKWSSLTVRQLLARGWWSSPASFTTKTVRHDIAEILLKVALNKINQIKFIYPKKMSTNVCNTISFPFNFIACISPLKRTGPILSKFRYNFIIFILRVLTPYVWLACMSCWVIQLSNALSQPGPGLDMKVCQKVNISYNYLTKQNVIWLTSIHIIWVLCRFILRNWMNGISAF